MRSTAAAAIAASLILSGCGDDGGSADPSATNGAATSSDVASEPDGGSEPARAAGGELTDVQLSEVFDPLVQLVAATDPGDDLGSNITNVPDADFQAVVNGLRVAMEGEGWTIVSERETDMAGNPAVQISFDADGVGGLATIIDQGDNIRVVYGSNQP